MRSARRARGQSGGLHCTAGQYGYVPLGQHLVLSEDEVDNRRRASVARTLNLLATPSLFATLLLVVMESWSRRNC